MPGWDYDTLLAFLRALESACCERRWPEARSETSSRLLLDRRYPTGSMRRELACSRFSTQSLGAIVESIRRAPSACLRFRK